MRIRGLEGLGGLGLDSEWLAGLVWEGLGCVGFVYKIVEIMAEWLGSYVWDGIERVRILPYTLTFFFFFFFALSNFSKC